MSASTFDRRHAQSVELSIEARVLEREEGRYLACSCADLRKACELHKKLDVVLHDLSGRLDQS